MIKSVQGSFHQADLRFGNSNGTQCACCGLVSVSFTLVKSPGKWLITDLDFIVEQMYSYRSVPPNKVAFHINVSSDASYDVNIILFKLLVLRYLTKHSSGESFAVLPNHAFFVELPTQL